MAEATPMGIVLAVKRGVMFSPDEICGAGHVVICTAEVDGFRLG